MKPFRQSLNTAVKFEFREMDKFSYNDDSDLDSTYSMAAARTAVEIAFCSICNIFGILHLFPMEITKTRY